jgi:hypothetical protein
MATPAPKACVILWQEGGEDGGVCLGLGRRRLWVRSGGVQARRLGGMLGRMLLWGVGCSSVVLLPTLLLLLKAICVQVLNLQRMLQLIGVCVSV